METKIPKDFNVGDTVNASLSFLEQYPKYNFFHSSQFLFCPLCFTQNKRKIVHKIIIQKMQREKPVKSLWNYRFNSEK